MLVEQLLVVGSSVARLDGTLEALDGDTASFSLG